jgi:hypothetical protein
LRIRPDELRQQLERAAIPPLVLSADVNRALGFRYLLSWYCLPAEAGRIIESTVVQQDAVLGWRRCREGTPLLDAMVENCPIRFREPKSSSTLMSLPQVADVVNKKMRLSQTILNRSK